MSPHVPVAIKSENLTSSLKKPGSCSRSPADMAVFTVQPVMVRNMQQGLR